MIAAVFPVTGIQEYPKPKPQPPNGLIPTSEQVQQLLREIPEPARASLTGPRLQQVLMQLWHRKLQASQAPPSLPNRPSQPQPQQSQSQPQMVPSQGMLPQAISQPNMPIPGNITATHLAQAQQAHRLQQIRMQQSQMGQGQFSPGMFPQNMSGMLGMGPSGSGMTGLPGGSETGQGMSMGSGVMPHMPGGMGSIPVDQIQSWMQRKADGQGGPGPG